MAASDRNLRSPVWQFFSVISIPDDKKKAKCNMCKVEVSYSGGSTGTMSNHLKHVHKSLKTEVNDGKPKIVQKPITAYKYPTVTPMSKLKWQQCTVKLAEMCARDLRPINIVEGGDFQDFCKELNPSYDVPCRTTVSNYVSIANDNTKSELIKTISSQPGVSLTTDHWTSYM